MAEAMPGELIEPIGPALRDQVIAHTHSFIRRAEAIYTQQFPSIPILFDLSGSTAGMYKVVGKHRCIRYNPWIFSKYFDENITGTVPHEVAHFAIDQIYGGRRIKPHGTQWRVLMSDFNADPGVTFNLDLSGIPQRRQLTHRYACPCQVHEISTTRHNRVQRGKGIYHCRRCSGTLVYAKDGQSNRLDHPY